MFRLMHYISIDVSPDQNNMIMMVDIDIRQQQRDESTNGKIGSESLTKIRELEPDSHRRSRNINLDFENEGYHTRKGRT